MRKNTKNQIVSKAMALAMTTMITATSAQIPTYAAGLPMPPAPPAPPAPHGPAQQVQGENEQNEAKTVSEASAELKSDADKIEQSAAPVTVTENGKEVPYSKVESDNIPKIKDDAKEIDAAVNNGNTSVDSDVESAKGNLDKVDTDLTTASNSEKTINDIGTTTQSISSAVDSLNKEIKDITDNANNDIQDVQNEITSANTTQEVDAIIKKANDIKDAAEKNYNNKLAEYDELVKQATQAATDLEAAKKAFDEAVKDATTQKEAANTKLEQARKDLQVAEDKAKEFAKKVDDAKKAVEEAGKTKVDAAEAAKQTADKLKKRMTIR